MKLFRFDPAVGKKIDTYDSSRFVIAGIAHMFYEAVINCAYLEPNGVIGFHKATIPQLFLVVQGEGWVRGEAPESRRPIKAGEAAFWDEGEWHESGTETGMVVILIEGEDIDPTKTMPPV